jgi:DNA-binding NtrC family response regulator
MTAKKLHVMVVDDNRIVKEAISEELRSLGCMVYTASLAEEADRILGKHPIDIIFLDLKLPGLSGLEYLERIKETYRDPIVIIMTVCGSSESAVEAIDKGAYDYVIKPIEPGHVELLIKRAMKRHQIDLERRLAVERRLRALDSFAECARETEEMIKELKREVNRLCEEMGKPPRYEI